MTDTTAQTSCTGGSPVLSFESAYCASAGSISSDPSFPNDRIRSCTAAVARARSVTSRPIIRTVQPAANTMAAASGSAQMLYSAAGFTLPRPAEPPMITKSRTHSGSRGSRRTASAMLVSGPVATSVISPGAAAISAMMKSIACPSRGPCGGAGRTAPPRPDSPCTCPASSAGRSSGAGHPAVTGTPGAPANDATASAFAVVFASPTLPATVVIPVNSIPGCPMANAIASASSMPGSQSRMTLVLMVLIASHRQWTREATRHAPAAYPADRGDRPGDRGPDQRRGAPPVREDAAHPVGELRVARRARGVRHGADQQVLRGLAGPAVLRGPAVHRPHRDDRDRAGAGAVRGGPRERAAVLGVAGEPRGLPG